MRKLFIILAAASLLAATPTFAQAPKPAGQASTAAPKTQTQKVKALWDYKKELGLSTEQVDKIKEALVGLQKDLELNRQKATVVELEIKGLIEKGADIKDIRPKLQDSANLQVEMRAQDITAAAKINAILSADQLKKWHAIQAKTRAGG